MVLYIDMIRASKMGPRTRDSNTTTTVNRMTMLLLRGRQTSTVRCLQTDVAEKGCVETRCTARDGTICEFVLARE